MNLTFVVRGDNNCIYISLIHRCGSFTGSISVNSLLSPLEILLIALENKYLGILFIF